MPEPIAIRRKIVTHAGRKPRILIVDDSPTYRLWLEMMLQHRYEVFTAEDGEAALRCGLSVQPDLILLDVVMPKLDGLSVCEALRDRPETRTTPIILVTSQNEEWDVEAGFTSGCTDYVMKPVDQLELLAKVESWLDVAVEGRAGA
jgi:PleD family two-component response regulator